MKSLKAALLANAVFSAVIGFFAAMFTQPLAAQLQTPHVAILRLIGISLLLHTAILLWARNQDTRATWTRINLWVIAPYPVLIAALIALGEISGRGGVFLASMDALVVGFFAIWQYQALRRVSRPNTQPSH